MAFNIKSIKYSGKLLSREEEISLGKILNNSKEGSDEYNKALETLIERNIRFVISVSSKLSKKHNMPIDDIISEGYIGLIYAARKFNPEKYPQCKFISYAKYWIEHYIRTYILESRKVINIPRNLSCILGSYNEMKKEGLSDEKIMKELKITKNDLVRLDDANFKQISLSEKIDIDNNKTVEDIIESNSFINPYVSVMIKDRENLLHKLLEELSEKERDIVVEYYCKNEEKTLDELSKKYNLSRERIRQIKEKTLLKLRERLKEINFEKEIT